MSHIDLTNPSRRSFIKACATLAAALGLSGAGTALAAESSKKDASAASDKAGSAAAESVTFPITIKHALGETVIEKKPERVACIGWGNQDAPLAVGIAPVGFSRATFGVAEGESMMSWTKEAYEKLGVEPVAFDDTDGTDFEAVNDVKPDIILCAYSGITQDDYDKLAKIAPTVAYPTVAWSTLWRDQTLIEAEALGLKPAGEQVVADCEKAIADALAGHPELQGKTGVFVNITATDTSSMWVYTLDDPRAAYLTDLGLAFPPSVDELTKGKGWMVQLSSEVADQMNDVDILFTYGDDAFVQQLKDDALLGVIPAVANGAVVALPMDSKLAGATTPTCLSIPATVADYVDLIAKAAANVK